MPNRVNNFSALDKYIEYHRTIRSTARTRGPRKTDIITTPTLDGAHVLTKIKRLPRESRIVQKTTTSNNHEGANILNATS